MFLISFFLVIAFASEAKVYEVKMLNKDSTGQTMVFEPSFLKIEKGDSVKFLPTDKSHSVQSLKEGTPAGVAEWKGGMNKEITVKFDQEGVHVFKCLPHFVMGMVGAVQVGAPKNLAQIKALSFRGKAKERFAKVISQIK